MARCASELHPPASRAKRKPNCCPHDRRLRGPCLCSAWTPTRACRGTAARAGDRSRVVALLSLLQGERLGSDYQRFAAACDSVVELERPDEVPVGCVALGDRLSESHARPSALAADREVRASRPRVGPSRGALAAGDHERLLLPRVRREREPDAPRARGRRVKVRAVAAHRRRRVGNRSSTASPGCICSQAEDSMPTSWRVPGRWLDWSGEQC